MRPGGLAGVGLYPCSNLGRASFLPTGTPESLKVVVMLVVVMVVVVKKRGLIDHID
jgi:hypothetical protein